MQWKAEVSELMQWEAEVSELMQWEAEVSELMQWEAEVSELMQWEAEVSELMQFPPVAVNICEKSICYPIQSANFSEFRKILSVSSIKER
jgi:hypothetical protein